MCAAVDGGLARYPNRNSQWKYCIRETDRAGRQIVLLAIAVGDRLIRAAPAFLPQATSPRVIAGCSAEHPHAVLFEKTFANRNRMRRLAFLRRYGCTYQVLPA
jgi:hypothetical protein